ncbi:hypothetical protein ABEV40_15580, partial [Geobacillus thermocatenulatus]
ISIYIDESLDFFFNLGAKKAPKIEPIARAVLNTPKPRESYSVLSASIVIIILNGATEKLIIIIYQSDCFRVFGAVFKYFKESIKW